MFKSSPNDQDKVLCHITGSRLAIASTLVMTLLTYQENSINRHIYHCIYNMAPHMFGLLRFIACMRIVST